MKKSRLVKSAVIGCGNVSPTYLYTLSKSPDAEVVSVADINPEKAEKQAKEFNINEVYTDYKDVLKDNLDAVFILTPHYEHPEQTIFFAKNGLDVLCEKPLASKMSDIEDMIDTCDKEGVKFSTMLQRRLYPNTIAAREAVKEGLLGKIRNVELDFSCYKKKEFYNGWRAAKKTGGGGLMSQTLHRIDQIVFIFGEPIAVEGVTKTTRDYLEIEDYAKGKIYFRNGFVANLEANNSSLGPNNQETLSIISISGENGKIVLSDDLTPVWSVPNMPAPLDANLNAIPLKYRPAYYGPCHEIIINDFVDSVMKGREPLIEGKDSIPAMKVIFGFYKSAESNGKRINLTKKFWQK